MEKIQFFLNPVNPVGRDFLISACPSYAKLFVKKCSWMNNSWCRSIQVKASSQNDFQAVCVNREIYFTIPETFIPHTENTDKIVL